jgi:hypothetical protein
LIMFFTRKARNRRLKHNVVLDVKLNAEQTRAARWRFTIMSTGLAILLASILLGVWRGGQWMLDSLLYSNDAFAIQQIDVQTDGVIGAEHLRRWTMVRPGQNLLALDLDKVRRDMELVQYVDSASVERILPHTLRVRVFEREPLVQVMTTQVDPIGQVSQSIYQLDDSGSVMRPIDPRLRSSPPLIPPEQLPVLLGLNPADLVAGHHIETPSVHSALEFVSAFNHSAMAGMVDVQWIDISAPGLLIVHTRQGSDITFGLSDYPRQLKRWQKVFELYAGSNKNIASLDLSISNNLPLRWVEANAVPPAFPKPVKPPRSRRKNV